MSNAKENTEDIGGRTANAGDAEHSESPGQRGGEKEGGRIEEKGRAEETLNVKRGSDDCIIYNNWVCHLHQI